MESSSNNNNSTRAFVPQAPPLPSSLILPPSTHHSSSKLVYLDKRFKDSGQVELPETNTIRTRSTFKKAAINRNAAKRLSCEELEDLKEKFVDFIKLDQVYVDHQNWFSASSSASPSSDIVYQSSPNNQMQQQQQQHSPPLPPPPPCLLANSESDNSNSMNTMKPEPPARTVSIRNSSIYSSILKPDDSISIKSGSIYGMTGQVGAVHSQCQVRNSRSVFSIYEEEATETCSSSGLSSHSSSSATSSSSPSSHNQNVLGNAKSGNKLERLSEAEIKKIESMYRSIGSIVCVSPCTCDLFTTTSEQIASMLSNCWKMEMGSFVPIWIFDTGYNLKRAKKLTLLFVDRQTAFPLIQKPLLVTQMDQFRNPNNDKRLTFTLDQRQIAPHVASTKLSSINQQRAADIQCTSEQKLVGLIQFSDFLCCHEFFKFYREIVENMRNFEMFAPREGNTKQASKSQAKQQNFSSSMLTLNNTSRSGMMMMMPQNVSSAEAKKFNRYSEYIPYSINYDEIGNCGGGSVASMSGVSLPPPTPPPASSANSTTVKLKAVRTITKNCISSPCAFQHVNSLKCNNDQHIKLLIENFSVSEKKLSKENLQIRSRKK
jgi:hypothetical protein